DLAANMATVDLASGKPAAHCAGHGRELAALATTDLVADQTADHRAGHRAADVAVALGQALLHHDVVADLPRRGRGGGLAHRLGTDHGGEQLGLLGDRDHADDLGIVELPRLPSGDADSCSGV